MSNLNPSLDEALAGAQVKKTNESKLKDQLRDASISISQSDVGEEVESYTDIYEAKKQANRDLNMYLNAIKVWTPMITAVSANNHAKSEEDASLDLHRIVRDCSDITRHILNELESNGFEIGSESNKWVIRTILANVSDSVTRQYALKDKIDVSTTKKLLSQAVSFTTGKIPDSTSELNKHLANDLLRETTQKIESLKVLFVSGDKTPVTVEEDTALACSIMKSSELIIEQLEYFSWFSDPEIHVNKLSEIVISGAGFFFEKLLEDIPVKPSRSSRLMLLQSAIDKSSKCLCASYKKEALNTLTAMKDEITQGSADSVQDGVIKKEVIKKYRGVGIPYERINEAFERSLGLHISFTRSGAQFLKSNLGGLLNAGKKSETQPNERKP